ncbi:rho GTPase-activating protein [Malassezia caprae]|uniref:Rho GTPase-activating protein n=1 Tax=Malassezia caprae TaxID=1381934 RepID=A0AAF0E541_9BASI|nr:rho GTPase-activating protein [Malassezia caprae]
MALEDPRDLLQEQTLTGFVKRSTGPLSLAWWTDALTQTEGKEPGRGWRPFKAVLVGDTLMFYKVPSNMVPEVRRTFQIRSTQWPLAVLSTDDPQEINLGDDATTLASAPDKSMHTKGSIESLNVPAIQWTSPQRHPDLILVPNANFSNRWITRIESGSVAALAHELVFGTQRVASADDAQDTDTKTFLHLVFYALCTARTPLYLFLCALQEFMALPDVDSAGVQRVALFLDLLLWKRPLLHEGHESTFFEHLHGLIRELGRTSPSSVAPMVRQLQLWRDQLQQEDRNNPTDWLGRAGASLSHRTDLAPLALCWNVADLVRQDPTEIARQIQSFHADRLAAFLRVPVTAYRLSSSVTECLLRSFRFDASRPHWLTHVILRQLLVDESPERQGDAIHVERVRILEHWIEVATSLLHRSDLAGWVAPPTDPVTYESLTVELDMSSYRDAFLLSYRGWISASDLFESLVRRWNQAESASREMALHERKGIPNQFPSWMPLSNASFAREHMDWDRFVSIRLHVLLAFRRWLELYPREWIADLIQFDALYTFLRNAHQECNAISTDSPFLVETINAILQLYPSLPTNAIASMGLDCFAPCESTPNVTITFDWALPAYDLLAYLESLAALPYSLVSAHDLARASLSLEQIHSARREWFEAATRDHVACLSIYRLMRCLPPGRQVAHAPAGSSLWDMLPPSIREICMIHETVREWVEAQVTEPRLGLNRRMERLSRLLDAVLLSRASMVRAMRCDSQKDGGMSMAIPQTFVESAILEGITSERAQSFHAAWRAVSRQRHITSLMDLLAQRISLPDGQVLPPCTPDIGWTIAIFSHWAVRPRARHGKSILLEFSLYMSMADLVNDALALQNNKASDDTLNTVRARLGWLRESTRKAHWPREKMLEDAAMEAMMDQELNSEPMALFDALNAARAEKLADMHLALRRNSEANVHDPSADFFAKLDDATLAEQAESMRSPCDALLQAVPVSRVSSVFRCYGAHIQVWPYQKHPFVMELEVPSGGKCTLKLPNYDDFCEWLTRLQGIPHVRVNESFDVGAYAAQVADHLGRTSASHVFGVPLRELHIRSGGAALPPSIERLLEEIESRGLQEQGIYRISGTRSAVTRLQQALNSQPVQHINFNSADVHVLTSVFKLWLRDLPEPLVPFAFYDALIESERVTQHEERVRLMRKIVASFPPCHYLALERVTYHLVLVAKSSRSNLMAAHNIGLVFGSTLLNPPTSTTQVARGIENLGRAAHIVKIMVVMNRYIFNARSGHRARPT